MPFRPHAPIFDCSHHDGIEGAVHETYRMLGRERVADFEREARKRDLAAAARGGRPAPKQATPMHLPQWRLALLRSRLAALLH